jgi:hypothetical protein
VEEACEGASTSRGQSPNRPEEVDMAMLIHHRPPRRARRWLATLVLLSLAAAPLALAQQPVPQVQTCPDAAIRHWDKIVFTIVDPQLAAMLQLPLRSDLDIKVLDDPTKVADLKKKVIDFLLPVPPPNLPDFRRGINIVQVAYAIQGCAFVPAAPSPDTPSCSMTVTSGPGATTATAICGLLCPSAHVTAYIGAGTPFMSTSGPLYVCNGQPTIGTSSITCTC